MQTVEYDTNLLLSITNQENINFLNELNSKKENVTRQLSEIERKKEKILQKISRNERTLDNQPKETRQYISNAESVLESIEIVYKNLTELLNGYRSIEKSLILITERCKLNVDLNNFEDEINVLLEKIELTKAFDTNTEKDNEKNYFIINSFLEKEQDKNRRNDDLIDFENLTLENLQDNPVLRICEKRVELPYTKKEVEKFMETYPNEYKTVQDVITKEFMVHISTFNKHPVLSRFREAYYLCRNKEMMSIFDSFSFAKNIMFRSDINPYIIAAVKSVKQLRDYINCLEENRLDDYAHFKIMFEVNPLAV